jgi:hypothetical protein
VDGERMLEQQVVVLAHRPVDHVLDRDHARHGPARDDLVEDRPEAAERAAIDVTEGGEHGVLGERARLARVGDRPRARHPPIGRSHSSSRLNAIR